MDITTLGSELGVVKYCHPWRLDGDVNSANECCGIGKGDGVGDGDGLGIGKCLAVAWSGGCDRKWGLRSVGLGQGIVGLCVLHAPIIEGDED